MWRGPDVGQTGGLGDAERPSGDAGTGRDAGKTRGGAINAEYAGWYFRGYGLVHLWRRKSSTGG